jgi:proline dehydrogenase
VLGEEVVREEDAHAIAAAYREVLDAIERDRLDASISVKPTGLGLKVDRALCREQLEALARDAAARGTVVEIDMEDSSATDGTLALYRALREAGLDNVGVALQARLRRTLDDVRALAELRPSVRLCKGIYLEPPEVAYQGFEEIRAAFVRALEELLAAGCRVAIATHDEWLLGESRRLTGGLARDAYEFQMLLGVRAELGDRLVRDGHRLRIYVPFGERWYEYSLRRLQENPKVAGYVMGDVLGRFVAGAR